MTFPQRLDPSYPYHLAEGSWPLSEVRETRLSLAPSLGAAAQARLAARELLTDGVEPQQLSDVLLALTELVTNAVRHPIPQADARVDVHLGQSAGCVRVEVCDSGAGFAVHEAVTNDPRDIHGLLIVDRAASRWGVSDDHPHCVWFELELEAAPTALA